MRELEGGGEVERLAAMDVIEGLGYLWPPEVNFHRSGCGRASSSS